MSTHRLAAHRSAANKAAHGSRGFTLIELMITVAVVGILAAIAYPSYQEFVAKGRRAQATAQLMAAHQWMERFYTENLRYDQTSGGTATTDATLFPARFSASPPPGDGGAAYSLALVTPLQRESYVITATRTGAMSNDRCGKLSIDQLGTKTVADYDTGKFSSLTAAVQACWRQ